MISKGAILVECNSPLEIDTFSITKSLQDGQIIVRVIEASLCGSQIREVKGQNGPDKYLPHLLGHEGIGEVIDRGSSKKFRVGDYVVLHWRKSSGQEAGPVKYKWGTKWLNAGPIACFAEYAVISENRATLLPVGLVDFHARAALGCGISTGWSAVMREASEKDQEESTALVIGLGGVGLSAFLACVGINPHGTYAVEPQDARLNLVRHRFPKIIIKDQLRDFEQGSVKFDRIFECSGGGYELQRLLDLVKPEGQLILAGMSSAALHLIDWNNLLSGKTVKGVNGGGFNPDADLQHMSLDFKEKKYLWDNYTVETMNLVDINEVLFGRRTVTAKVVLNVAS